MSSFENISFQQYATMNNHHENDEIDINDPNTYNDAMDVILMQY